MAGTSLAIQVTEQYAPIISLILYLTRIKDIYRIILEIYTIVNFIKKNLLQLFLDKLIKHIFD